MYGYDIGEIERKNKKNVEMQKEVNINFQKKRSNDDNPKRFEEY